MWYNSIHRRQFMHGRCWNMEEKRMGGKIGGILGWVLAIGVGLALAAATYVGFFANYLLPSFCGYQLSPVLQRDMGQALPEGGLAVVDLRSMPEQDEAAAYRDDEGRMRFGRLCGREGEDFLLKADLSQQTETLTPDRLAGAVRFYVSGLGGLVTTLETYRLTVAATAAVYILALLAALFTRGKRRRQRRRRELVELFAFYGEKYDMEEADIDY